MLVAGSAVYALSAARSQGRELSVAGLVVLVLLAGLAVLLTVGQVRAVR